LSAKDIAIRVSHLSQAASNEGTLGPENSDALEAVEPQDAPAVELVSMEIHNGADRPVVLLMIGEKYKLVMRVLFNKDIKRPISDSAFKKKTA